MKTHITIFISLILISTSFTQQDLLPVFTNEINYIGDAAYFNGSPFTGLLVDRKTNKKMGEFSNGFKNGIFTEYYDNGKKKTEGYYKNGIRDGLYTEWFSNGQQKSMYNYKYGNIVDGKYSTYLENGQIEREQDFNNGVIINEVVYKNGEIVETKNRKTVFHPNGILKFEGYTINNKKDGLWTRWYDSGKKEEEATYEGGILNGKYAAWYENNQKRSEGTYINGVRDSIWTFWYDNGRIKSLENYKNGKKDEEFRKNKKVNESGDVSKAGPSKR